MDTLRILVSYAFYKKKKLEDTLPKGVKTDVFLDSGAFTAMTRGKEVKLKEYANYILENKDVLTVYANIDVIRNAQKTWDNQKQMEEEFGLAPLPVFHVAEEWKWLERYLERYRYISLGVAGTQSKDYFPWIVRCFQIAKSTNTAFHGFGITDWNVLRSFPWYSIDSSTWGGGFRFARMPIFQREHGKMKIISLRSRKDLLENASYFRSLSFSPDDFMKGEVIQRKNVCAVSASAYILAESYLKKRWLGVYHPLTKEKGPKVYLVEVQNDFSDISCVIPLLEKVGV